MPYLECVLVCPHSVALLLHSSPSPMLPFFASQNTRHPGPHGPLLAHLDPYFSTCYPHLEKQILIFDFGDEATQIDQFSQWLPRGKDVSHARA